MNEITSKFTKTKFIRNSSVIIIFWNVLLAIADEDPMPYVADMPSDLASSEKESNFSTGILDSDKLKEFTLGAHETKELWYLMQSGLDKISVFVTSCRSEISGALYFRNDAGLLASQNKGTLLQNYTVSDMHFYSTNLTDVGLYAIVVTALNEDVMFSIYISHDQDIPKLFQTMDREESPRQMKIKFDFKNNYAYVSWPEISDEMNYTYNTPLDFAVSVSQTKFYKSLCSVLVDNTMTEEPSKIERVKSSIRSYTIVNMTCGMKYYVNVFLRHASGVSVPYARINFIYQKPKPIGLKDGRVISGNLIKNLGKLSFKYKVGNYVLPKSENILTWYIIPCDGRILVEIKHKKKVIQKKTMQGWGKIKTVNPVRGDRYVMKITDASKNEFSRTEYVQVLATMRSGINPLSNVPENLSVNELGQSHECYSEKKSTMINWTPMTGKEPVTYRIQVKELDHESTNVRFSSECALDSSNSSNTTEKSYRKYNMAHKLGNLKPDRDYIIRVTAKKHNSKVSIPYNLLRINKNDPCS